MKTSPAKKHTKHGLSANEVEAIAKLMGVEFDYHSHVATVTMIDGTTVVVGVGVAAEVAKFRALEFIKSYICNEHHKSNIRSKSCSQ